MANLCFLSSGDAGLDDYKISEIPREVPEDVRERIALFETSIWIVGKIQLNRGRMTFENGYMVSVVETLLEGFRFHLEAAIITPDGEIHPPRRLQSHHEAFRSRAAYMASVILQHFIER